MLSLTLQLLILFAILPVFSTFLSSGDVSITTPALSEFVPLGVLDESPNSHHLREALNKNKRLEVVEFDTFRADFLESGKVAAILVIPERYDESLNRVLGIELHTYVPNIKEGLVYDAVFSSISETSEILTNERKETFGVTVEDPVTVERRYLKPVIIGDGQSQFSSFFLSYLVPLMLFFPIFTVGSIILDSVVGERERKTVEAILVSPIRRSAIVYSKFLSASAFVLIQLVLWLLVFGLYGIPIQNTVLIVFMVMVIDSAVISTALFLAFYSKTVKESNILLMLLYTTVFISLIVSLSLNYFNRSFTTPFTAISALVSGENPGILLWSTVILLYSGIVLGVSKKFVERDDILFGPRPSLSVLLEDLALWLFSFGKMGYLYLSLVFGIFAITYSVLIEIFLGIFIIFTFGVTNLLVPLFALVEELIKPVGVYLLAARIDLDAKKGILLGVFAGSTFFLLESAAFALATYYLFPSMLLEMFKLRVATTLFIHALSSGIVGYGIVRKEKFIPSILLAVLIHSLFNLVVTGGAL